MLLLDGASLVVECVLSRNLSRLQEVGMRNAQWWKWKVGLNRWNVTKSVSITSQSPKLQQAVCPVNPVPTLSLLPPWQTLVTMTAADWEEWGRGRQQGLGFQDCWEALFAQVAWEANSQDEIKYARNMLGKILEWEKNGGETQRGLGEPVRAVVREGGTEGWGRCRLLGWSLPHWFSKERWVLGATSGAMSPGSPRNRSAVVSSMHWVSSL